MHLHLDTETLTATIGDASTAKQWNAFLASRSDMGHVAMTTDSYGHSLIETDVGPRVGVTYCLASLDEDSPLSHILLKTTSLFVQGVFATVVHQHTDRLAQLHHLLVDYGQLPCQRHGVPYDGSNSLAGFPTVCHLTQLKTLKLLAGRATQRQSLYADTRPALANFLKKCPEPLETLSIKLCSRLCFTKEACSNWCKHVRQLTSLEIHGAVSIPDGAWECLQQLSSLNLAGSYVQSSAFPNLTNLSSLDLTSSFWRVSASEDWGELVKFVAWPCLRVLKVAGCGLFDSLSTTFDICTVPEVHTDFLVPVMGAGAVHLVLGSDPIQNLHGLCRSLFSSPWSHSLVEMSCKLHKLFQ